MSNARWLSSAATADYIGVRVDRLPRLVKAGRIPPPDYSLGPRSPRWDRTALDSKFTNGVSGGAVAIPATDWEIENAIALDRLDQQIRGRANR